MTDEMTWFEQEVILRRRMLVMGELDRPRGRDDSIHARLAALQIVELPEGGFVFVSLSYSRLRREFGDKAGQDQPELTVRPFWAATLDEVVEHWKSQFFSGNWTLGEHDSVRAHLELDGPPVKLADPWLYYHLGVFAQMVRQTEISAPQGEFVREKLVNSLEAITISRVKRLCRAIGRS